MATFPKEFLFATATSAYQVEGNWPGDGKGENIWDHIIRTEPDKVKKRDNADIACDSYHLYKEDVALVKEANFDVYRFSISWPRILPKGDTSVINQKGVDYYHNLIDELLKNGIQPMVTMYHWDLPQSLQDIGGWANPLIADYMHDYADLLFQLYGNKVKWWVTLNEPLHIAEGYEITRFAPALNSTIPVNYIVLHNALKAHGRIFRLYDEKYRSTQKGKLGLCFGNHCYQSKSNSKEDLEATNRAWLFTLGLSAAPIYGKDGDYPKLVRDTIDELSKKEGRKRSRLPEFTDDEKKLLKGAFDFLALNHYTTKLCSPGSSPNATLSEKDLNVTRSNDPKWPSSEAPWIKVVPFGVRELLKYIKNNFDNPPVFITENGYCDRGEIQDKERVSYYREYLKEISNAINNHNCNVIGYTAWSLLDNFEWFHGYQLRFGLVYVDFGDEKRKRTPKSSFNFFKQFLKTRIIQNE